MMGVDFSHFYYVIAKFRTLGRLHAAIRTHFPEVLDDLWTFYQRETIVETVLGPPLFRKRAMLLYFAVAHVDRLPLHLLGHEEIWPHIEALHRCKMAELYRLQYLGFIERL